MFFFFFTDLAGLVLLTMHGIPVPTAILILITEILPELTGYPIKQKQFLLVLDYFTGI